MAKVIVQTDDLPKWAVKEHPYARSYLNHLSEPVHPISGTKNFLSDEEIMLRQQFDAALNGKRGPMVWLLKRIAKDNADRIKNEKFAPIVSIHGAPRIQPLTPVLEALGCISVEPPVGGDPAVIHFSDWFASALSERSPSAKLEPVRAWVERGAKQEPHRPEEESWT